MSKHTPGPWKVDGKRAVYAVQDTGAVSSICIMATDVTEERVANARLIAAAPDMADEIERLRAAICEYRKLREYSIEQLEKREAEIKRLRGEKSYLEDEVIPALRDEAERLRALSDSRVSVELLQIERATGDRLRAENSGLRAALEGYACPGIGPCYAQRLKDGSCIRALDGTCGDEAHRALEQARKE